MARAGSERLHPFVARWAPYLRPRARERGQSARAPTAIPAAGWVDIALRTVSAALKHDLPTLAAGVTFFAMLAFIPAVVAASSLYGLFSDAQAGMRQASALEGVVPAEVLALVNAELARVGQAPRAQLAWTAGIGLFAAFGSLSASVAAMLKGLNLAYAEEECRGFWTRRLVSGGFAVGLLLGVPLTFSSLLIGRGVAGLLGPAASMAPAVRLAFLALVAAASLALLYRYGPCRRPARWRWVTPGGAFAAVSWLACSSAVTFYLANVAHYRETYGWMGALLAVMVWLWVGCGVALLGAELNAQVEAQTDHDTRQAAD